MDKTPPRNRLIAFYTALAVATLISLKPAFDSYFDKMRQSAVQDRLATYSDLTTVEEAEADWNRELCREDQLAQLESGDRRCTGSPIAETMAQLARRGRTAMPQIRPEAPAEPNLDPLRGWSELPQEVEEPEPEPAEEPGRIEGGLMLVPGGEGAEGGPSLEGLELRNPLQGLEPPTLEAGQQGAEPEEAPAPSPSEDSDPTDSGDE